MNPKLIVYGHHYCPDAIYMERYLRRNHIDFEWRDVAGANPGFQQELRLLARGYLSVPTIVLPDGMVLVEPNPKEILESWLRFVK